MRCSNLLGRTLQAALTVLQPIARQPMHAVTSALVTPALYPPSIFQPFSMLVQRTVHSCALQSWAPLLPAAATSVSGYSAVWQQLHSVYTPLRVPCQQIHAHTPLCVRYFATSRIKTKIKPRFFGGKLKPNSAFKERFKVTGSGKIMMMHPGHRHRRFRKTNKQNRTLKQAKVMHDTYAKTMKKLGFTMRGFQRA